MAFSLSVDKYVHTVLIGGRLIQSQCASRSRECVFVKSRRGGKRIRKAAVEAVEAG